MPSRPSHPLPRRPARPTPAPWTNVLANPGFGCLITAEGGGYSWSTNSQQNALTPWPNDPVSDAPHDIIYLRDADSGEVWSAGALPIRVPGARCVATHGKGWTELRIRKRRNRLDLHKLTDAELSDLGLARRESDGAPRH